MTKPKGQSKDTVTRNSFVVGDEIVVRNDHDRRYRIDKIEGWEVRCTDLAEGWDTDWFFDLQYLDHYVTVGLIVHEQKGSAT